MGECLDVTAKCGMVFLAVLNILTFLLGVGLMVVGILLRQEMNKDSDITAFINQVDFGSISLKQIIEIVFIVVICIGVFTTCTSISGCVGALCKIKCLLIIYIIILVLSILLELTILGFWIALIQGVDTFLKGQFNSLLKKYAGPLGKDGYSIGWNLIFALFKCCGVEPVTSTKNDFRTLPSAWWATSGSDVIPSSCCKDASSSNYGSYNNTMCTENLQNYHTSGCYDAFQEIFDRMSAIAISVVSVMVVVEIVAMIFSIVITCQESKKQSNII
ncbi:hypothetical protein ACF0H5_009631 [Mactra antiquata]